MLEENQLYCMDAIEFMKQVDDKVVDLILTDLPYGTTACEWDNVIPLDKLWQQFKRILKDSGVVVLTASQPFTTDLVNSNRNWFRYCWIWYKDRPTGLFTAQLQPMKYHEDILVFGNKNINYNPQMFKGKNNHSVGRGISKSDHYDLPILQDREDSYLKFPKSVLECERPHPPIHPTQKPLKLFRYLIKTYTNKGDLVLDCCVGSGTTAVACKQTDRRFLCNDNNPKYIEISNQRLNQTNLNAFSDTTETLNESPSLNTDLTDFSVEKSQIEATPQLR